MTLATLRDLYVHELSDLLDAEKQLVKELPKMAKAASSPELKGAFESHLRETKEHVGRLEEIFTSQDMKPEKTVCKGMRGLLEECEEAIDDDGEAAVKDALLISTAQRVEHYEMAGYGCAKTFAELLGDKSNALILQTTLEEEKATAQKLTELAAKDINLEAAHV
jgi:ferritin-like metal-binding protein YciE